MRVDPGVVGRRLATRTVTTTTREALAYAAACGEGRAEFLDDTRPGFAALPTQCVAQEFRFIGSGEALDALGLARGGGAVGFHAYQDSRFDGPIPVGEPLRVEAEVHGVAPTGAGCLATYRFRAVRAADGGAVYESLAGILLRGVETTRALGVSAWPAPAVAGGRPFAFGYALPGGAAHVYAECTGVWHPMHTEMSAARRAGLAEPIMQGVASWAIAVRELRDRVPGLCALPLTALRRLRGRFRAPVEAGTRLQASGTVRESAEGFVDVAFEVRNARGALAVAEGYARFDPSAS